jgi:predicted amidohydrolase
MKIAGIQLDITWEDPAANFLRGEELAREAVEGGSTFVVFPEMFNTGFSMEAELVAGFAEETRSFLSRLSEELGVFVLAGYGEPAAPRPANACSIFDPTGTEILHYTKIHPFSMAGEDEAFLAGEMVSTVEVEGIRVTPFICYDLRFPEIFRGAAVGTDLFCVLANWPDPRRRHWSLLLRARAIENQAYVLGVNRSGEGGGLHYTGDSALIDPMGTVLDEGEAGKEVLVGGLVDAAEVRRIREHFGFLDDRKPELYGRLEKETP